MDTDTALNAIVTRIEGTKALDAAADPIQGAARSALRSDRVRAVLAGEPLGHRLHPALVTVPIGSWLSASVLDLTAGNRAAARRLIGFGCLAALPTAAAGARDWLDTTGGDRRTGLVHALLNDVALTLYFRSWRARRHGHGVQGVLLSLVGSCVLAAAGWLGGHLAYSRGVGVEVEVPEATTSPWKTKVPLTQA